MKFLRIIFKPFKLRDWVERENPDFHCEEVTGLGYHPERLTPESKALLTELPRMAAEMKCDDCGEIEKHRLALRTGEWGDGKIFVFPLAAYHEF